MKKCFLVILSIFMGLNIVIQTNVIYAKDQVDIIPNFELIDEADEYEYYVYNGNQKQPVIYTYKDNELIYKSYFKDDGNVYTLINGEEVLSVVIEKETNFVSHNSVMNGLRAPSEFILTQSNRAYSIRITGTVIDAGKAAIRNAIISGLLGLATTGAIISSAGLGAIGGVVDYIWTHCEVYETTIYRNTYMYNGCDWLTWYDFVFPTGHTVGIYHWKDNPSLGIAPTVCKLASQKYPKTN